MPPRDADIGGVERAKAKKRRKTPSPTPRLVAGALQPKIGVRSPAAPLRTPKKTSSPLPPIKFVPTPRGEVADTAKVDPGGGVVVFGGKNRKDYIQQATQRAIMRAQQPRLEAAAPGQIDAHRLSQEEQLQIAVDRAIANNPSIELSARRTARRRFQVSIPKAPDIRDPIALAEDVAGQGGQNLFFGPANQWVQGKRGLDTWTIADILGSTALLAVGTGGEGLAAKVAAQPLKAARAGAVATVTKQGFREAFEKPALTTRAVKSSLGFATRVARKQATKLGETRIGKALMPASGAKLRAAMQSAASPGMVEAHAAVGNALRAQERQRFSTLHQLWAEETGAVKTQMAHDILTGGARPGMKRATLDAQLGFGQPVARSAIGRAFERYVSDNPRIQDALAKSQITRDTVEKGGYFTGKRLRFDRQYALRPAIKLQNAVKGLKGTEDFTALRLIGEQIAPSERAAFHIEQAAADPQNAVFHQIQAELADRAAKYVELKDGKVVLRDDAPKRLRAVLAPLEDTARAREDVLRKLGELSDSTIEHRINAPGAVVQGAEYITREVNLRRQLEASPARQRLVDFLSSPELSNALAPAEISNFLTLADANARAQQRMAFQDLRKAFEKAGEDAGLNSAEVERLIAERIRPEVDAQYERFVEFIAGQPGDPAMTVKELLDTAGPPPSIDSASIAREVLESGHPLPKELQDPQALQNAIDLAYQHTKSGDLLGGRDWYDRAARNVVRMTEIANSHPRIQRGEVQPLTTHQVAQIVAITSAGADTVSNTTFAKNAIEQWIEHGDVWTGRWPRRQSQEIMNVLHGQPWDGRKRSSFFMNIAESVNPEDYKSILAETGELHRPVTVDMWISRIFGKEQPGTNYSAFELAFQRMADQIGWTPKEVQAAAWVGIKNASIEAGEQRGAVVLAGAADAYERGVSRAFDQLTLEGMTEHPGAKRALTMLKGAEGGFSLKRDLSPSTAKDGYYAAFGAYEHKIPMRRMQSGYIEGFRDAHSEVLKQRGTYIGGWHNQDDGNVYLDISRRFRSKKEAIEWGREQGQLAIYDAKNDVEIATGLTVEEADAIKTGLKQGDGLSGKYITRVANQEPLAGLPPKGQMSPAARSLSEAYMQGRPYLPPAEYRKVDPDRAAKIAAAYEHMVDALSPNADPAYREATLASYDAFAKETLAQYDVIQKGGYVFEFEPRGGGSYASPWDAMADLRENKHLFVFPTDEGFGMSEAQQAHPLLQVVPGLTWKQDGVDKPVTYNDLFRGVHDFFGHFKEGVGFRADGEENAWRSHVAMYSEEARGAMTTETRGQNSWVNYGPHGVANQTADQASTVYAEQKIGLLPQWAVKDGALDKGVAEQQAQKQWDDLIDSVIRRNGWPKSKDSRRFAEDWLDLHPDAFPGWQEARDAAYRTRQENVPDWAAFLEEHEAQARGFVGAVPDQPGFYRLGLDPVYGDIGTLVHEWGHFMRFTTLTPGRKRALSSWAGADLGKIPLDLSPDEFRAWAASPEGVKAIAAEEKVAEGFVTYVLEGQFGKDVPKSVQEALRSMRAQIEKSFDTRDTALGAPTGFEKLETYKTAGLNQPWDRLPKQVRDVYDFWLSYDELKGGMFAGPTAVRPGRFRVPYKRGLPVTLRNPLKKAQAMIAMRRNLAQGRGAMGEIAKDPSLTHAFKGKAMQSGLYSDREIANASVADLQKAVNLDTIRRVRKALLTTDPEGNYILASPLPLRADDLAVKINPSKDSPKELQAIHDLLAQSEGDLGRVNIRDVAKEDWSLFERLKDEAMPSRLQVDGEFVSADEVARRMLDEGLQPLDNIVWVPRRFLDHTGLFDPPAVLQKHPAADFLQAATVDVFNDLLKSSLLYLNPAYYGMNIVGNLAMNFLHEGVFMPLNLSRAFALSHQLGDETQFIDFLMGHGLMSVADLRAVARLTGGQKVSGALSHWSGVVVDMIPRRAAWIHEARRAGFRSAEDIRKLLNDPDMLYDVTTKAKQAMVDFDEMGRREREVLARYVFVYPWIKGAIMNTARLPKEHPIVVAGLALAYEKQQQLADEKIGPRPTYLDLVLPIGEAQRYGQTYPLVLSMRQVFTAATPYEIGQNLLAFAEGNPNGQALTEMLLPWYGTILNHVIGYDPFRQAEVKRGVVPILKDFLGQVAGMPESPLRRRIDELLLSDEERRNLAESGRLYPRDTLDVALGFGLGSVAPTPVNTATAHKYASQNVPTHAQKTEQWVSKMASIGVTVTPEIRAMYQAKQDYNTILGDIRKRVGRSDLTDAEILEARYRSFAQLYPEHAQEVDGWIQQIQGVPDGNAAIETQLEKFSQYLGWDTLASYDKILEKSDAGK